MMRRHLPAMLFLALITGGPRNCLAQITYWEALQTAGASLFSQDFHKEAEEIYLKAIKEAETGFAPDDLRLASTLFQVSLLYAATGRFEEAEMAQRRHISVKEAALGGRHPMLTPSLMDLGDILLALGRSEEADEQYQKAIEIDRASFGPRNALVATDLSRYADFLRERGLDRRARKAEEDSRTIRSELGIAPDSPDGQDERRRRRIVVRHPTAVKLDQIEAGSSPGPSWLEVVWDGILSLFQRL